MFDVILIDIPSWIFGAIVLVGIYYLIFGGWFYWSEKIKHYSPENKYIKFIWEVLKDA
jgi:threonine/homoserine/homoserine lactone efflux protein